MCSQSEGAERTRGLEQTVLRLVRCSTLHLFHLASKGKAVAGAGSHGREDGGAQEQEELLLCEGVRVAKGGAPLV